MLKYCLLLASFLFCQITLAENTDTLIKNHSLTGKEFLTKDFALVVGGPKNWYSLSPTVSKLDSVLRSLDMLASGANLSPKGVYTKYILPPNSKLKILEVYKSKPSLIRSFLTGPTTFAIMEAPNGKKLSAGVTQDKILFDLNGCKRSLCRSWKNSLKKIIESKGKEHSISVTYHLLDEKGIPIFKKIRPPYPDGMLERSQKKLISFLKSKKIPILDISTHHPRISIKPNHIQYGDLYLSYEDLGIKSVSILEILN